MQKLHSRPAVVTGILELHPKGYGFLRDPGCNLQRRPADPFVSQATINRLDLRIGATITGQIDTRRQSRSGPRIRQVDLVEGLSVSDYQQTVAFDDLRAASPESQLKLEHPDQPLSMRLIDLVCPIGLGQRALIAAPPRAGKTTLLNQMARSISWNHPDVVIKILLIDERPEEVTEISDQNLGDVYASNLDEPPESHAQLANLTMHHCRRIAESGKDVVLFVDSLTRLARAMNKLPQRNGTTGSGGLNTRALDFPKKLFGSGRRLTAGGSLTLLASVLIETDNRMDEVIFREFKGTGNMDLVLNQRLADQRIWPAIDIQQSATRRVELLQDAETLSAVTALRRSLLSSDCVTATRDLVEKMKRFPSNAAFIDLIHTAIKAT